MVGVLGRLVVRGAGTILRGRPTGSRVLGALVSAVVILASGSGAWAQPDAQADTLEDASVGGQVEAQAGSEDGAQDGVQDGAQDGAQDRAKPNFVIILIDDAALMDLGVYGGEARTPHIDALAERGAMFTQFRTSPMCAPSRAMLLTGVDNHRTGLATIPEVLPPEHKGKPGYSMSLEPGVLTVASRLKPEGYRTLLTGKWHLGSGPGDLPNDHGFDRSYALDASGADNWEDKSYMPYYAEAPWFEDGKAVDLPENFYSSEFIVDKMIEYLDETPKDDPFLAFLSFLAVHIPVQAPAEYTANYLETYADGWDAVKARRWEQAQALGLVQPGAVQPPFHESMRDWDDLTAEQKELFAARMAANAGMLEAMDDHIGRFMAHLAQEGLLENTVFIVTSDNGPEPTDGDNPTLSWWLASNGYHRDLEGIGEKGSYGFIGPEFASAAATPSSLFKFYASEGGLRAPLIMAGPAVGGAKRVDAMAVVTDVAPTILDLAGAGPAPEGSVTMDGVSLMPVLSGEAERVHGPDKAIGIEVSGNAALYKGDYKVVRNLAPYGDGQWRLFNLAEDPGETTDLAETLPDVFADLRAEYDAYAARVGVLAPPPGYNATTQVVSNILQVLIERNLVALIVGAIVALLLLGLFVRFVYVLLFRKRGAAR